MTAVGCVGLWTSRSERAQRRSRRRLRCGTSSLISLASSWLPRRVEELGEEREQRAERSELRGPAGRQVLHSTGEPAPATTFRAEVHDERAVWRQRH